MSKIDGSAPNNRVDDIPKKTEYTKEKIEATGTNDAMGKAPLQQVIYYIKEAVKKALSVTYKQIDAANDAMGKPPSGPVKETEAGTPAVEQTEKGYRPDSYDRADK